MHLRNLVSTERSINSLPLISLGKSPFSVTVPAPVQLRDTLLQALDEPFDRTHAVLRVFGATLERRQRDDAVVYNDPNLFR